MKPKRLVALILSLIGTSLFLQAEEIQVSDIGNKVILIGGLGKPLGTVATIDGQLISEPTRGKSGQVTAAFRVNKVDGKPLEKSQSVGLIFRTSTGIPPVHINKFIQLSGYESGAFVGTPDGARDLLGKDASPLDWKFQSTIHVIKLQVGESPKP